MRGKQMVNHITMSSEAPWYDLFSRGARDWLRHNEKVRESVQQSLPDLIAGSDLITGPQDRTVRVPVRMLEHARFRLSDTQNAPQADAGQGQGGPGGGRRPARRGPGGGGGRGGGSGGE